MAITQNTYTGNGSTVDYSFTFPYLETTDVKVTINGTPTTAYTFANATMIQFNTAPANGAAIRIYRDTDDASLAATFYSGSAIRAQDLNDNFTQNLYVTQEVNNNSVNIDGSNPMVGPLNMNGFQITNLPVPAVDANAATKKYVDDRFGNLDIPGHTRWRKVATASQTIFSGTGDYGGVLAYSPTREQVYINGALQQRGVDYAADNGTSVIFTVGLTVGDVVDIICVNNLTNSSVSNAGNITYSGQFTGQTARTVAAKLGDVVSVKDFGAVGDGVTDDTAAIQAAINNAKPVFFPPGTYIVRLSTAITLEGGATVCALKARTGMQLLGSGWGQTIIKLKDGESTDASPKYFNIISSNEVLDGVVIDGIKFNINGQNNKISPNRGTNVYNRFNCAAFMVSGSVATVGVAARISNSRFSNCWIENSPGVTCIGLAQSNIVGNAIGKNVAIFNNVFYNNGIDTDDHSSVFMWGENINVFNNVFDAAAPSNGLQGPRVAAELHGDDNVFSNNIIQNYYQGIWVDGNLTTVASNQIISNNIFTVSTVGIGLFSEVVEVNNAKKNLIISDNIITITNDYPLTVAYKYGLSLKPSIGNFDGVFVSGNTIRSSDTHGSIGIDISTITNTIKDITIDSNTVIGFSVGIVTTLAAGGTQDNVDISNNNILRVSTSTLTPTFTQGITISGKHTNLRVSNNQIQGTVYYGLLLDSSAVCQNLNVEGNNFIRTGLTVDIVDNITVSGTRSGRQALTFSALPTQSTWVMGDVVYTKNTTELGTAGSKYLITGYTRITNGTGNVLNTDWLQNRVLTGN